MGSMRASQRNHRPRKGPENPHSALRLNSHFNFLLCRVAWADNSSIARVLCTTNGAVKRFLLECNRHTYHLAEIGSSDFRILTGLRDREERTSIAKHRWLHHVVRGIDDRWHPSPCSGQTTIMDEICEAKKRMENGKCAGICTTCTSGPSRYPNFEAFFIALLLFI